MAESEQPTVATDNPVNVSDATEEQKLQAAQEIVNDPSVSPAGDADAAPSGGYDDEEAYPFRKLQDEIKARNEGREEDDRISGRGSREELVARLVEDDAAQSAKIQDNPNVQASANGGIRTDTVLSGTHADILQGLSSARKQAQLAAIAETEQA